MATTKYFMYDNNIHYGQGKMRNVCEHKGKSALGYIYGLVEWILLVWFIDVFSKSTAEQHGRFA
jgi:hypothetical protein